jgi:hypothetical protein
MVRMVPCDCRNMSSQEYINKITLLHQVRILHYFMSLLLPCLPPTQLWTVSTFTQPVKFLRLVTKYSLWTLFWARWIHVRHYLGCDTVWFGNYRRSRGIYCLYFRIVGIRFILNVCVYLLSYMASYSEDCFVNLHFHAASNLMPRNCLRSTSHSLCLLSRLTDC